MWGFYGQIDLEFLPNNDGLSNLVYTPLQAEADLTWTENSCHRYVYVCTLYMYVCVCTCVYADKRLIKPECVTKYHGLSRPHSDKAVCDKLVDILLTLIPLLRFF